METLFRDVRFAARTYKSAKSVTLISILALSTGICANIVMFTLVNSLLIHPLAYPESARLVQINRLFQDGPSRTISYARFRYLERNNHTLESLAINDVVGSSSSILINGTPHFVQSISVSADFFRVLEVQPAMGRGFTQADDLPGAVPVVVISHRAWVDLFNRDPNVLGRFVRISRENYSIIGVMPSDFTFIPESDAWVPMRRAEDWNDRSNPFVTIGRLRPGISPKTAEKDIGALIKRLRAEQPESVPADELATSVTLYEDRVVGDSRGPLLVLSGAVGCVLLIACANIANLLLVRAVGRRKEIAIRMAIGASRSRTIGQLLTESTLLAAVSGAIALAGAAFVIRLIRLWQSAGLPATEKLTLDFSVLLFTVALILITGILFGIAPAVEMSRLDLIGPLREAGRATPGKATRRLQRGFVTGEIGLSAVLVLLAGSLLLSFEKLRNVDLGFRTENVLTVKTSLSGPQFQTTQNVTLTVQRVLERLKNIAGVQRATAVTTLPTEPSLVFSFDLPGAATAKSGDSSLEANWKAVAPEFCQVLRIRLHAGRYLNQGDTSAAPPVALVNDAFVRKFMPGVHPVGRQILIGREMGPNFTDRPRQIVGVVADTRDDGLQQDAPPTIVVPLAQVPDRTMAFLNRLIPLNWVIQSSGDPSAYTQRLREVMFGVDVNLAASDPKSLAQILSRSIAREQIQTVLVSVFASLALLLGAVGLYGVISYSVAERQHEIGIRRALGASGSQTLWLVVRYGLTLVIPGLVIGVVMSLMLRRFLAAHLFGLQAPSLFVYSAVLATLFLAALGATIVPTMRAVKVDPNAVLRV